MGMDSDDRFHNVLCKVSKKSGMYYKRMGFSCKKTLSESKNLCICYFIMCICMCFVHHYHTNAEAPSTAASASLSCDISRRVVPR